MSVPKGPTRGQVKRRRRVALSAICAALAAAAWLILAATVFAPIDKHGNRLLELTIDSRAVGQKLGVNVIVPPHPGPRGRRSMLLVLHGRGGNEGTFNEVILENLPRLHGHGPVVVVPDGGDHGYWHNREGADWDTYVVHEVIPMVERRFGVDPHRLAISGMSMGGFGAYDIALHHPGLFCAVGGHSPALWFEGSETAPGAFDDAADFEANDIVRTVQENPDAFGDAKVWNDYGSEDDFRVYDEGFVAAMEAGDADFTARSWPGAHGGAYWKEHWPDYQRFYIKALTSCPGS